MMTSFGGLLLKWQLSLMGVGILGSDRRFQSKEMLNKAILALSADAKPGTGPGLAHANQSLACLFAVSHPWLTGSAELFSASLKEAYRCGY
jgi:hypothetical protein